MGTRAHILVEQADGKIRGVYVHMDGDTLLPTLERFYCTKKARESLLKLGALSVLGEKTTRPPALYNTMRSGAIPSEKYCLAFHRDRGDDLEIIEYDSWKDYKKDLKVAYFDIAYLYLWENTHKGWTRHRQVGFGKGQYVADFGLTRLP